MRSTFRIRCRDAQVRAGIAAWIKDLGLQPPAALALEARVADAEARRALTRATRLRPVFRQPGVVIHTEPGGAVSIRWTRFPALAQIGPTSRTARLLLSRRAAARLVEGQRTFLLATLVFLLRRVGWYHVHAAAAVDPTGRGWLLVGDPMAGKSTTTAVLAAAGWRVASDDACFVSRARRQPVVHAAREPIALRPGGQRLLARTGGVAHARRGKVAFHPEELGGRWVRRTRPEIILLLSVGGDRTVMAPERPAAVLAALVRQAAWVILEPRFAQPNLELLRDLVQGARCYRVTLGPDLMRRPSLLLELVR